MEYNLQKQITSSDFHLIVPSSSRPSLTSFPARDFVTPGVAQITSLYSFYVPLYSESSLYNIQKNQNIDLIQGNQVGSGVEKEMQDLAQDETLINTPNETLINKPNESLESLNADRKRKLSEGIEHSFLHPKIFQTKTVHIEQKSHPKKLKPDIKADTSKPKTSKETVIKHKFKISD
jgi:hypothetical protein